MKGKTVGLLSILMVFLFLTQCNKSEFSSPRATLQTFFDAVQEKNKSRCLSCFTKEDRSSFTGDWNDSQIDGHFEYEILSEEIGSTAASLTVEMKADFSGTETFWFIKEKEGWKIALTEPPDSLFGRTEKIEWHSGQLGDGWGIPAVVGGLVIVGIGNPYHSSVHALDAKTGEVRWTYDTDIYCTSGALTQGELVFIASGNDFYCIEAKTGQLRWKFETGQYIQCNPYLAQDAVYFCSGDGHIYAVNVADGSLKWKTSIEEYARYSPILCGDVLYAGDRIFDAKTGERVEPIFEDNWPPPLVNNLGSGFLGVALNSTGRDGGYIPHSIGYGEGHLYKFSATSGDVIWRLHVGIHSISPVVVKDGVIYYTSANNQVHAIDEEIAARRAMKTRRISTTYKEIKKMEPEKRIETLNGMMEDPTIDENAVSLLVRTIEEDPYWDVGTAEKLRIHPIRDLASKVLNEKIWFARQAYFVSGNMNKLEAMAEVVEKHGKDGSLHFVVEIADFMVRAGDIGKLNVLVELLESNIPEIRNSARNVLKTLTLEDWEE